MSLPPKGLPESPDSSSTPKHTESPPRWYSIRAENSAMEEPDHRQNDLCALTAVSTPKNSSNGWPMLFTSPMEKLGELDINATITQNVDKIAKSSPSVTCNTRFELSANSLYMQDVSLGERGDIIGDHDDSDDSTNDDDSEAGDELGNITIMGEYESEEGGEMAHYSDPIANVNPPAFIRKRKLGEEIIKTPKCYSIDGTSRSMEVMSGIVMNESYDTNSKLSFSISDSTPCPTQPRKKFKGKPQESTPSQPSKATFKLLDVYSSRKSTAPKVYLAHDDGDITDAQSCESFQETYTPTLKVPSNKSKIISTPISQSTPTNSRPGSPAQLAQSSSERACNSFFVRPCAASLAHTASTDFFSSQLYDGGYKAADYHQNINRMPIGHYELAKEHHTMDNGWPDNMQHENHLADKRIDDPYLLAPGEKKVRNEIANCMNTYFSSSNILPLFEHVERNLDIDEMKRLLNNGHSVRSFYKHAQASCDLSMRDFLKKERVRWHPDKWERRLQGSPFDMAVIGTLSSLINALLEEWP